MMSSRGLSKKTMSLISGISELNYLERALHTRVKTGGERNDFHCDIRLSSYLKQASELASHDRCPPDQPTNHGLIQHEMKRWPIVAAK